MSDKPRFNRKAVQNSKAQAEQLEGLLGDDVSKNRASTLIDALGFIYVTQAEVLPEPSLLFSYIKAAYDDSQKFKSENSTLCESTVYDAIRDTPYDCLHLEVYNYLMMKSATDHEGCGSLDEARDFARSEIETQLLDIQTKYGFNPSRMAQEMLKVNDDIDSVAQKYMEPVLFDATSEGCEEFRNVRTLVNVIVSRYAK